MTKNGSSGRECARRKAQNISTEQVLAERYISDKNGVWCDMPPYVKKAPWQVLARSNPKATFTNATRSQDGMMEKWMRPKFAACMRMKQKVQW